MKKFVLIVTVSLMLFLTSCSENSTATEEPDGTGNNQPENITVSEEGIWPINEYTEGLPVPLGTVTWTVTDTEHENFGISVAGVKESAYHDYMELLRQNGFFAAENVSEKIEGQDYVSVGTLLTDNNRWLSIGYISDTLTVYISFEK